MRVFVQDSVCLDQRTINRIKAHGIYPSFAAATDAVRAIVGAINADGLSYNAARQVTAELIATRTIQIDPIGRQVAANAHLALALKGEPLYPAIALRLLPLGPFTDVTDAAIALSETFYSVFKTHAGTDLLYALAAEMTGDGSIEMGSVAIMERAA